MIKYKRTPIDKLTEDLFNDYVVQVNEGYWADKTSNTYIVFLELNATEKYITFNELYSGVVAFYKRIRDMTEKKNKWRIITPSEKEIKVELNTLISTGLIELLNE